MKPDPLPVEVSMYTKPEAMLSTICARVGVGEGGGVCVAVGSAVGAGVGVAVRVGGSGVAVVVAAAGNASIVAATPVATATATSGALVGISVGNATCTVARAGVACGSGWPQAAIRMDIAKAISVIFKMAAFLFR